MNVLLSLSLWLALIMSSSCGNVGRHEKEELTTDYYDYNYVTPTGTPEYDYNATFDYYFVTGLYEVRSKASGIDRLTPVLLLGLAAFQIWH